MEDCDWFLNCSVHGWNLNKEIPDASIAVIVRGHHNLTWHEDLRLMVRALMVECRRAGLHFWLLHQVRPCSIVASPTGPNSSVVIPCMCQAYNSMS